jgi:hypothetical protein
MFYLENTILSLLDPLNTAANISETLLDFPESARDVDFVILDAPAW